jgi:hypothetical protein
MGIIATP